MQTKFKIDSVNIGSKTYYTLEPEKQLSDSEYDSIKAVIESYGGHWSERRKAFIMHPAKVNFSEELEAFKQWKEFRQYYATPKSVANLMVEKLQPFEGMSLLEPSAGQGSLLDAVNRVYKLNCNTRAIELDEYNFSVLKKKYNDILTLNISLETFYSLNKDNKFNRIIMNPPFSHGRALKHLKMAYNLLSSDGILVALVSENEIFYNSPEAHWVNEELLMQDNVEIIELGPDAFIESGTTIITSIIVVDNTK